MNAFYKEKLKTFIIYTTIFGIIFIISFIVGKYIKPDIPFGVSYYWGTFCVFGSMGFGVIFPIILRLFFHNKAIKNGKVSFTQFRKQQQIQLGYTFLGTLFIVPAIIFPIPMVHRYVTVFAAIYAIYSVVPSLKKIIGETNLYNVKVSKEYS